MKIRQGGAAHAVSHELPFKDEMHELIEKEKHLLQLKVLEQKREAEVWKAKYESIVNKVGEEANKTGDFRALEYAADTVSSAGIQIKKTIEISSEGMQKLLLDLQYKWVLDLSSPSLGITTVKQELLKAVNNEIFSIRGAEANQISIMMADRCYLDEAMAVTLGSIMSKNNLQALSVAHNYLGPAFFVQFMNSLRARRKTPQYINLSGNVHMASVDMSPLLKNLTDSTWGLVLSLQDHSHGQLSNPGSDGPASHISAVGAKRGGSSAISKGLKKSGATQSKKLVDGLYSDQQQPEKALSFLKHLHAVIDPLTSISDHAGHVTKGAKKGAQTNKSGGKGSDTNNSAGGIIRTSNLTTLTVFGLTCNSLCIESITKLGEVLDAASPSLTDLDVSFSYIGKYGCKMLSDIISSPSCQLVRVGLAGNSIGDAGAAEIGMALRKNRTLTYLDVRSNNIEPPGLRSLCYALTGGAVIHDGFDGKVIKEPRTSINSVLFHIDIRGNILPESSVNASRQALKDWGLCVNLQSGPQYRPTGGSEGTIVYQKNKSACEVAPNKDAVLLFQLPSKMMADFISDDINALTRFIAPLYSIDLKYTNVNFISRGANNLILTWSMRPAAEKTSENGSSATDAWLTAPNKLGWEILIETSSSVKTLATTRLAFDSCLYDQHGADAQWSRCQALLSGDLPSKGNLVVRAIAFNDGATKVPKAIEFADCSLISEPETDTRVEGGDCQSWTWSDAWAVSLSSSANVAERISASKVLPNFEEYSLLRLLKHASYSETSINGILLSWSSKLITEGGGHGVNSNVKGLGYEWVVLLEETLGGSIVEVARGNCDPVELEMVNSDTENIVENNLDVASLRPWRWEEMRATIDERVSNGDSIILLARTKSMFEGSLVKEDNFSKPACSLAVKDCRIEFPSVSSGVAVGVFASHNAPLFF